MLISLWNYLRGYVIIETAGFNVERLINMAVHKGAFIWKVRTEEDAVTMRASLRALKIIEECAEKTGGEVRVIQRRGLPFMLRRYRKRKIFLAGIVFFLAAMYSLSMFVWKVDVTGVERLGSEEIVRYCQTQGLSVGVFKSGVDVKALERALMARFSDIGWVSVNIKGTRARITLTETIPRQVIIDRRTPCDIVAVKDGLVVSVVTSAGTPAVKSGDVVNAGDILVRGELVVKEDETGVVKDYVHADAVVTGKLYYEIHLDVPFEYMEKAYTGNVKRRYGISLFGRNIRMPGRTAPFKDFDMITKHSQLGVGEEYPLPVILVATTYREYTPVFKTRDAEQAKELADSLVTGRIIREFDFSADVVEKQFHFTENADRILVKCIVTTVEDIGREQLIPLDTSKTLSARQ